MSGNPLSSKQLEQVSRRRLELRQERALELARSGLLNFTLFTKPDYRVNWHHRELCRVLNRFIRGEIRFLMVFMPPRHGKSELVSRRLPAFLHGLYPDSEIMAASYNASLASDMTVDVQRIMDAPEYQSLFPASAITAPDEKSKWTRSSTEHEIMNRRGTYRGQGVGGTFTGRGANFIIVDDPIKGRETADSFTFREKLWKWYGADLRSRLEDGGQILVTQTRWHEDDLAGRLLALAKSDPENADQWTVFNFPAIKEEENDKDPRKIGEALWPDKYDLKALAAIRSISRREFESLYQQRPTALEGGMIKRSWLKYYKQAPEFDSLYQSWDLSFKDSAGSDFVVGQIWGIRKAERYLVHQVRDRMDFPATLAAIKQMTAKYPKARMKLIEEKANGAAVISMLKKDIFGIVPFVPDTSKEARLNAVSPFFEAGNVYLPDPSIANWVADFVEELVGFPNRAHDDQVDACTQFLLKTSSGGYDLSKVVQL